MKTEQQGKLSKDVEELDIVDLSRGEAKGMLRKIAEQFQKAVSCKIEFLDDKADGPVEIKHATKENDL